MMPSQRSESPTRFALPKSRSGSTKVSFAAAGGATLTDRYRAVESAHIGQIETFAVME
jgi:hypothetical protein